MYDLAGKKKLDQKKLWNVALLLAVVTVFYNIIEGLVSVGFSDLALIPLLRSCPVSVYGI
jgi:hypothetical protein